MTATTIPAASAETPRTQLNRTQKAIVWAVAAGAILIASLGFLGSYTAVADLAARQHFGNFAAVFPIAIDAGIGVLLSLDLLLTWLRIPFPVLRPMAWGFTAATIAFNASTSWPNLLGAAMHSAIPTLFVVIVEAARHAIGRLAQIHAGTHYENPPLTRWLLSPVPTYRIWRRMRMWHIQSYSQVVEMERETKILRATLKARHGRGWRRLASKRELLALRLAKIGTPVGETLAGQFEVELPARSGNARRTATATATATGGLPVAAALPTAGIAAPSVASPSPASPAKTASASPVAASPSSQTAANPSSVYLPAPASPTATATPGNANSPQPATPPAGSQPAPTATASKPATGNEQWDLDDIAETFRTLQTRLGKSPSDAALATELGVSRSRAQQLRTAAIEAGHTDLAKPLRAAS